MVVKSAEFITSIANAKDLSNFDILPQFAFVGRSNVGKSSLLNIFEVNKKIHFVDLPGYGFAKASKSEQQNWQHLIGDYFATRSSHLTIDNITIIEMPVAATKTNQHAQIGTLV